MLLKMLLGKNDCVRGVYNSLNDSLLSLYRPPNEKRRKIRWGLGRNYCHFPEFAYGAIQVLPFQGNLVAKKSAVVH